MSLVLKEGIPRAQLAVKEKGNRLETSCAVASEIHPADDIDAMRDRSVEAYVSVCFF